MRRISFALLIAVVATACTIDSDKLVRVAPVGSDFRQTATFPSPDLSTLKNASIEQFPSFDIGIIEFDEKGHYRNAAQHDAVLRYARDVAEQRGATIVVFVHGWHHSARVDDGNLNSFRDVLSNIASRKEVGARCVGDDADSHNRVVGIYIGWRGESIRTTPFNFTTIWARKKVAQRIGGHLRKRQARRVGEGRETRSEFENLLRELDAIRAAANSKARLRGNAFTSLTVTGHSLGGAMLVAAMHRIIFEPRAASTDIPRIGDVVVALNPAIEAEKYEDFAELAVQEHDATQSPVMIVIGSMGDSANRYLFTISRIPPTLLPMYWGDVGSSLFTVGFRRTMRTHTLRLSGEPDVAAEYPSDLSGDETDTSKFDMSKPRLYGSMKLEAYTKYHPLQSYSPFMTIYSDSAIIRNHSDIFSKEVQAFLLPFITATHRKNILPLCAAPLPRTAE